MHSVSSEGSRPGDDDLDEDMELAVEYEHLDDLSQAIQRAGVPVPEMEEDIRMIVRGMREAIKSLRFRKA